MVSIDGLTGDAIIWLTIRCYTNEKMVMCFMEKASPEPSLMLWVDTCDGNSRWMVCLVERLIQIVVS